MSARRPVRYVGRLHEFQNAEGVAEPNPDPRDEVEHPLLVTRTDGCIPATVYVSSAELGDWQNIGAQARQ